MIKTKRVGEILTIDARLHEGRILFTTDLHGCYDLLLEKLKEVAFDNTKDILIIGGDMCDRGPDSKYVLDYLNDPWIYCIRGNHEQLLIQSFEDGFVGPAARCLYANGGAWVFELIDEGKLQTVKAIYETFKSLPLAIELLTPTEKIGVIHAECPYNNWDEFKKMTKHEIELNGYATAQWARTNYNNQRQETVKGVDRLLVGHTPTESGGVEILGNTWYCDAGSFFRDKISFIQLI